MNAIAAEEHIDAVRHFNRFYTRQIGLLNEGFLASPFSLSEVRVLFELAHRGGLTARDVRANLGLDAGYVSRIMTQFRRQGLISARSDPADGRRRVLALTAKGRRTFATLERRQRAEVSSLLQSAGERQGRLLVAFRTIEAALADPEVVGQTTSSITYRAHRPGDMGWVVHRHGALYAQEYGWDERFEALVARIAADFIDQFDRTRERCWIAERGGEIVGSVFLVRKTKQVAKLRLLLVEPSARGLGIGQRLVQECIDFATVVGYRRITLWTQSMLDSARRIYERAGFQLVAREPHESFGASLVGETWQLTLPRPL